MLLLAYDLLRKKLLAAWKAARKRGKTKKMILGGEPKETAVSGENVPADGSNLAQPNEVGISARPHQTSRQLISYEGVRVSAICWLPSLL